MECPRTRPIRRRSPSPAQIYIYIYTYHIHISLHMYILLIPIQLFQANLYQYLQSSKHTSWRGIMWVEEPLQRTSGLLLYSPESWGPV